MFSPNHLSTTRTGRQPSVSQKAPAKKDSKSNTSDIMMSYRVDPQVLNIINGNFNTYREEKETEMRGAETQA